jgi:hypothetical protein
MKRILAVLALVTLAAISLFAMDAANKPYQYTAVTTTAATAIIPASGQAQRYSHLVSLMITTTNTSISTLTISDGTNTVAVFDFPNSAAAPPSPFIFQPTYPVQQSAPNLAWTITASNVTGGPYHVTAQYAVN